MGTGRIFGKIERTRLLYIKGDKLKFLCITEYFALFFLRPTYIQFEKKF